MIVDSSALIAMVFEEDGAEEYRKALRANSDKSISAANLLETAIVVDARREPVASREFDELLGLYGIVVAPVTESQAQIARQAYRDFGKGSGHRAQLNFGDCFAYALASQTGEPLLYKGDDFAHTGVRSAL